MNRRRGHLPRKLRIPKRISGLAAWYDASAEVLAYKDSSDLTSIWYDRSGNGNHATAAGAARPTWVANQKNGRGIMRFGGAQQLTLPSGLYTLPSAANTRFVVAKRASSSGTVETILNLSDGTTAEAFEIYSSVAGTYQSRNREGAGTNVTLTGTLTNYNIFESYFNGSNSQSGSINNGSVDTRTATTATGINSGAIGANNSSTLYLTGDVAEIILYTRELTATERSTIKTYLSVKWGITIS